MILDLVSFVTCMRKVEGNQKSVIQMEHKKAKPFFLQVSIFGVWRERERERHIVLNVSGIYIGYVIHNSCMHQRREGWHKNYNKFSVFN